jgi:hypothetical protein
MSDTATVGRKRGGGILFLVLILVNSAAVWGQAGWALEHIVPAGWNHPAAFALSVGFAAALEMIGVFLATMADEGEATGLPSGGVRLGSYAVGLISGGLNFAHWAGAGLSAAVAFGFLSAVSPFLWGIWSRVRRGRPVAPSRRFWWPKRSISLIRYMAWHGIVNEVDAITDMELNTVPELVPISPAPAPMSREDWAREALKLREETELTWEKIAEELGISPSYLYRCRQALKTTETPK